MSHDSQNDPQLGLPADARALLAYYQQCPPELKEDIRRFAKACSQLEQKPSNIVVVEFRRP